MDSNSTTFWRSYSQVEFSESAVTSNIEGIDSTSQPAQDVDYSIGDIFQHPELGMWPATQSNDILSAIVDETPQSAITIIPANSLQTDDSSITISTPSDFLTLGPQHILHSTSADFSFVPSNPTPGQMGIGDLASVRIAKHSSPTRARSDSIPWEAVTAPTSIHNSFTTPMPSYEGVPPFSSSSSSLAGALQDASSEYRAASLCATPSEWSDCNSSPPAAGNAGGYAPPMPQTPSLPPTMSEDCIPAQQTNTYANPEVHAFDHRVVNDDGYVQNFAADATYTTHSYFGL